jgi:hypothetical protein
MNSFTSKKSQRLISAVSDGWQSTKANVIPGLIIVTIAAFIVIAYYQFPAVSTSLDGLVKFRQQLGVWFAMAASAIGAGIIPGIYLLIVGRSRKGPRGAIDLLFTCLVWATTAFVLDRFYIFQAWLWGSAVNLQVLVGKMLIDQLIFTPLVGVQIPAIGSRLRDLNYDLRALWRSFRRDWLIGVTIPLLIACWLTWVPGSLVIYSLPLPLQIPMMVLIQCFFALEVAYASSKM